MRRIFAFLLFLSILVTFTACGDTTTENTISTQTSSVQAIELTKDNFNEYCIFNVSLDDFLISGEPYVNGYDGCVTLNISTALKKDVVLENGVINGKVILNGFGWAAKVVEFTLELDTKGECRYSQQIKTNSGMLPPETPTFFILKELSHAEPFVEISDVDFVVKNAILQVEGTIVPNN